MIYNKLVRDKIPDIIAADGKKCAIEILSERDYLRLLDEKLNEELGEYYKDHSIEELADLMEVIYAIVEARGSSIEELERIRNNKAESRGIFSKRIKLIEVFDKQED